MKTARAYVRQLIDGKSSASMSRFLTMMVVLNVLYCWIFACIWNRTMVNIPDGVIWFVATVVTGRAVQSFGEAKKMVCDESVKKEEK